jgi:hypothetical protein
MTPNNLDDLYSEKILPPFLGELGYEVRHFIAIVEPYLRSGFKLISKRPELYPDGTTLFTPDLYQEISKLKKKYNGQEVHSSICVEFSNPNCLSQETLNNKNNEFENELRKLLIPYIDRPGRTVTSLDIQLTSAWKGLNEFFFSSYHGLKPSYKPKNFIEGNINCPSHLGVQFRKIIGKDENRNSNIDELYPLLLQLADQVNLPLFVYGEASGCDFPDNCNKVSAFHHASVSGLGGDLSCLKNCVLMFSPDSGWTDLMGWLQIPTIVTELYTNHTYMSLIPFKPIIDVLNKEEQLITQFNKCVFRNDTFLNLTTKNSQGSHIIPALFDLKKIWGLN